MLSITTDYVTDRGNPQPYLKAIAEAGFSHIHWCHQWNTDFVYMEPEVEQIQKWLAEYGLQLLDIHGSDGVEKSWISPLEHQRLAGMELVRNRIDFAYNLGSDTVVMHIFEPQDEAARPRFWEQARKSLDALQPYAGQRGVRLALENLVQKRLGAEPPFDTGDAIYNFATISRLFDLYSPDYLGLCYDSGHAHIGSDQIEAVALLRERLMALHLHDNDGVGDQHKLPFSGGIGWDRVAEIIADSGYAKGISMEVSIKNMGIGQEEEFLAQAYAAGQRLTEMVAANQTAVR